ncbi:hypothetical protein HPB49_012428 [Dermacentor silvarum]|uniref:Uncharacterized protein n=1 Tax=Dermacentor silvarum TaxID=543639 RepID=A0ACB8CF80_DERSI|nr:hypothetical protein HPB49_012428 [Dermacentor silvarum]
MGNKTEQARRYVKKLSMDCWLEHCEMFNKRTGLATLYRTYRAMVGKKNKYNTVADIMVAMGPAADTFFPHASVPKIAMNI